MTETKTQENINIEAAIQEILLDIADERALLIGTLRKLLEASNEIYQGAMLGVNTVTLYEHIRSFSKTLEETKKLLDVLDEEDNETP